MRSKRKAAIACRNNIHDSLLTVSDDEDIVTNSSSYIQISDEDSTESCGSVNDKKIISDFHNKVDKSNEQCVNQKLNNKKTVTTISNMELKICFNAIQSAALLIRARDTHINTGLELLKTNFMKHLDDFNYLKQSSYWADKILIETDTKSSIFDFLAEGFFPTKDFLIDISKTGKKLGILGSLCSLNVAVSPEDQLKHDSLPPLSSMLVSNPVVDQHGAFINSGTYIKRMCWAPINDELHQDQFLAVAVYKELTDRTNTFNIDVQADQMVQFYNCGKLQMKTREACLPKLEMVLTHNWGNITDMSWSPQPLPAVSRSKKLIGHLALCCTDGFIRIIPISKLSNSGCLVTLNNNQPIVCLGAIRNKGRVLFPTTMHWRQQFPDKIVAGYNTGHVAIFVLESSVFSSHSSILERNIYLKPSIFRVVFDGPCRSVQICPYNWRLVSCSSALVSHTVIVDFDQPRERHLPSPVDVEGTIGSRLIWPIPGDVILLGTGRNINNIPGLYLCSVQKPPKRSKKLILHNISSIDLCSSLNIVPIGTRSGQVRILSLNTNSINDLLRAKSDSTKCREGPMISKFYFQYHLTAKEPITRTQSIKTEYGTILQSSSCCACPANLQCVHKLISKFSISITKTESEKANDWQLDSMLNVHEIATNPNPGSSSWIATAIECGLIHIVPITHMYRADLDKMSTGSGCNILDKFSKKLSDESLLAKSIVCLSRIGRRRKYPFGTNYNTLYRQMGKVYSKHKRNANNSDFYIAPEMLNESITNVDMETINVSTRSMKTKSTFITDYFDDSTMQKTKKRELKTPSKIRLNKSKNQKRPKNSCPVKSTKDKSLSKLTKAVSKEASKENRRRLRSNELNELLLPSMMLETTVISSIVPRKKLHLIESIDNNTELPKSSLKIQSELNKSQNRLVSKKKETIKIQTGSPSITKFLSNVSNKNHHSTPKKTVCLLPTSFISPIISPWKRRLRSNSSTNKEIGLEVNDSSKSISISNSSLGSREKGQSLSQTWNPRTFLTPEKTNIEDQWFQKVNKISSNQLPVSNFTRSRSLSESLETMNNVNTKMEVSKFCKDNVNCSTDFTEDPRNLKSTKKYFPKIFQDSSDELLISRVTRSRVISDNSVKFTEKDLSMPEFQISENQTSEKDCDQKAKRLITVYNKDNSNSNIDLSTSRVTRSKFISNSSTRNNISLEEESTNNLNPDSKASLELEGNKRTLRNNKESNQYIKNYSSIESSITRVTRSRLSSGSPKITIDSGEEKLSTNIEKLSGVPEANPRKIDVRSERSIKRKSTKNEKKRESEVKKMKIDNCNVTNVKRSTTNSKECKQSNTDKRTEKRSISLISVNNQVCSNFNDSFANKDLRANKIPNNMDDLSSETSPRKPTSKSMPFSENIESRNVSVIKVAVTNQNMITENMDNSVANVTSDFSVNISTTTANDNSFDIKHSYEKESKRIAESHRREKNNENSNMIAKPLVKKKDGAPNSIKYRIPPSLEDIASSTPPPNRLQSNDYTPQSANLKYMQNFFSSTKRVLKTDIDDEDPEIDLDSVSRSVITPNFNVSNSSSRSHLVQDSSILLKNVPKPLNILINPPITNNRTRSKNIDYTSDLEQPKNTLERSILTNPPKLKTSISIGSDIDSTSDNILTQISDFKLKNIGVPIDPKKIINPKETSETNKFLVLGKTRSKSRSKEIEDSNSYSDIEKSFSLNHESNNLFGGNKSHTLDESYRSKCQLEVNSDQLSMELGKNIEFSSQKSKNYMESEDILKNLSISIVPIELEKSPNLYMSMTKELTKSPGSSENDLFGSKIYQIENDSFTGLEKSMHLQNSTSVQPMNRHLYGNTCKSGQIFPNNPMSHSTPKVIKTSGEPVADMIKPKNQSDLNKDKMSIPEVSVKKYPTKKSKVDITNSDRLKRLHDVLSIKRLELFSSQSVQGSDEPSVPSSSKGSSWWGADRFREMKKDTDVDLNKIDDISLVSSSPKKTLIPNSSIDDHMDKIKKVICRGLSQSEVERNSAYGDGPELLQPFRSLKASKNQNLTQLDNT